MMAWGEIMIDAGTFPYVLNRGSVTDQIYLKEVLETCVRLFSSAYGSLFIYGR